MAEETQTQTYTGGCHCGAIRFTVESAPITAAVECNCSHCAKKGLLLAFVPRSQFRLTEGEDKFTEYHFNKKKIDHRFCSICGVQPFAYGEDSDGNKLACLNVRCIDDIDLEALQRNKVNGKDF
jgi:hypothetical protein